MSVLNDDAFNLALAFLGGPGSTIPIVAWKCCRCGRRKNQRPFLPHKCGGQYFKHWRSTIWKPVILCVATAQPERAEDEEVSDDQTSH